MKFSDFGQRYSGYSGITHLMDDLSEGLAQEDVVMLGGGNPANIPPVIARLEAVLERLQENGELIRALTNYDAPQGRVEFRENLANFFRERHGWDIDASNIALTHGSQTAFFNLFNTFAGKSGDGLRRVLIPLVPEYIGYCDLGIEPGMLTSQQARIQRLDDGFFKYQVDFERLEIGKDIGLVCVSRPTNPSGNVLTDAECEQLDRIACQNDIPLLIDNAYGTPFPNIIFSDVKPFWNDNCIVCMSLSKLGLPGARTGIVIANRDLIRHFSNLTAIFSLAPSGLGAEIVNQLIVDDALQSLCDDLIRPFYRERAQLAIRLLRDAVDDPRLQVHKCEGSMFLWLWFEGLGITTSELYRRLKGRGLLVVPGRYFFPGQETDSEHAESCIRMNYVQDEQDLQRGIEILARTLRECW